MPKGSPYRHVDEIAERAFNGDAAHAKPARHQVDFVDSSPSASPTAAQPLYDIAVIGGGINGCGIARDAAGRGFKTLLAEADDLASATSSASTKLIHGGLRYLEYYQFLLVRHALIERETLWRMAPHIIWPMRFVLPHRHGLRPAWLLRLGLLLYDHIGGRKLLPPTRTLRLDADPAGAPLKGVGRIAFEYSDCCALDSRLVVLNARDAADRGAEIRTRVALAKAAREGELWRLDLRRADDGACETVFARALINATGPWVASTLALAPPPEAPVKVRLVQGSHIVVRKLFEHERGYFFQNPDGRMVFAIPYEDDFTLIGATDQDYAGDPRLAEASEAEIAYLIDAVGRYFRRALTRADVVSSFSGVRPLYDDGASAAQDVTRDYVIKLEAGGRAPLINIIGGKITTYRRLAEQTLKRLAAAGPEFRRGAPWTANAPLPGGDFPVDGVEALAAALQRDYPFLDARQARRLARSYGTLSRQWLAGRRNASDCGRAFGAGLTEAEVVYLVDREFARTAEDVVWRRTRLGLRMRPDEIAALDDWMKARRAIPARA